MPEKHRSRHNPWLPVFALAIAALVGSLAGLGIAVYRASSPSNTSPTLAAAAVRTQTASASPSVVQGSGRVPRTVVPQDTPEPTPTLAPQDQPTQTSQSDSGPPDQGRWIDVDVTNYTVRLMDGTTAEQVIGPVAVGAQIDTGAYESTATGLFHVYSMNAALTYDPPYKTYISDWVGFDPALANGFHSFLKDANGNIVDAATGNVSNGCIRTPDPQAIYAFAQIGMPVYVHR